MSLNRVRDQNSFISFLIIIYHVDPLLCPKCFGSMRIISFIEDEQLVKKILNHLDLWDVKRKPPPCTNGSPPETFIIYDQSSAPSADGYLTPLEAGLSEIDLSRRSSTCWVVAESDLWGRSSKSEAPGLKNEDGRVSA